MKELTKEQKELQKIEKLFRNLPEQHFLEISTTQDQINEFLSIRNNYLLVAECWKNLYLGSEPSESLLKLSKGDRYYVEEITVWFNEIWVLVQRTFPYIKQHFKKRNGFELPMKNSLDFFRHLTTVHANREIIPFFLPYKEFSHSNIQKASKICSQVADKVEERKLNHTEEKKINAVLNGLPKNLWLTIAVEAWKENKNFKSDVESLVKRMGKICELNRKKTAKDRSFAIYKGRIIYNDGLHGRNGYKLS